MNHTIEKLIEIEMKKRIRRKKSVAVKPFDIAEMRADLQDLPHSNYCCERTGLGRTDYRGYIDLPGCDVHSHALYLCLIGFKF